MNREELIYFLWFYSIKGIGFKKFRQIKNKYKSLKEVYFNRKELEVEGVFGYFKDEIKNFDIVEVEKIFEFCEKNSINIIFEDDRFYFDEFKVFDYVLVMFFVKGDVKYLKFFYKILMVGI